MKISRTAWEDYISQLREINEAAAEEILSYLDKNGMERTKELLDYSNLIAKKYGAQAGEVAASMYDAIAQLEGVNVAAAVPAEVPQYSEVAKTISGTLKIGNPKVVSEALATLVKKTGTDTMLKNASRDRAEFAWVPNGDTCAYCMAVASNGWREASPQNLASQHSHLHANCDCTFAVRFKKTTSVAGYKPEEYKKIYDNAEGKSSKEKINSIRREQYAENKDEINAQKRQEYAERKERLEGKSETANKH